MSNISSYVNNVNNANINHREYPQSFVDTWYPLVDMYIYGNLSEYKSFEELEKIANEYLAKCDNELMKAIIAYTVNTYRNCF